MMTIIESVRYVDGKILDSFEGFSRRFQLFAYRNFSFHFTNFSWARACAWAVIFICMVLLTERYTQEGFSMVFAWCGIVFGTGSFVCFDFIEKSKKTETYLESHVNIANEIRATGFSSRVFNILVGFALFVYLWFSPAAKNDPSSLCVAFIFLFYYPIFYFIACTPYPPSHEKKLVPVSKT